MIEDLLYNDKTLSCGIHPVNNSLLCLKEYFSLGSSPITMEFQFLYFFKILVIAEANLSKPLAAFNLPEKIIVFCFLGNLFILSILG